MCVMNCTHCNKTLKPYQNKYCSNECQQKNQYESYIAKWKAGRTDGNRGIKVRALSKHIKRYLLEKYEHSCDSCGWSERHLVTNTVPLEINHIDGNSDNNSEYNLELLCPNCHALTPTFRGLNRGKGRSWRK